jgi:acetoin utilization protein AcuB
VVSVEPDDRLGEVKRILEQAPFHHLLVESRGRLVGVISDRDLMAAISPYAGQPAETTRDAATLNKRAHQIMSRHPRTVTPETTLRDAVETLLAGPGGCLPVVDADEHPVGIVTWRDLLSAVMAERAMED